MFVIQVLVSFTPSCSSILRILFLLWTMCSTLCTWRCSEKSTEAAEYRYENDYVFSLDRCYCVPFSDTKPIRLVFSFRGTTNYFILILFLLFFAIDRCVRTEWRSRTACEDWTPRYAIFVLHTIMCVCFSDLCSLVLCCQLFCVFKFILTHFCISLTTLYFFLSLFRTLTSCCVLRAW